MGKEQWHQEYVFDLGASDCIKVIVEPNGLGDPSFTIATRIQGMKDDDYLQHALDGFVETVASVVTTLPHLLDDDDFHKAIRKACESIYDRDSERWDAENDDLPYIDFKDESPNKTMGLIDVLHGIDQGSITFAVIIEDLLDAEPLYQLQGWRDGERYQHVLGVDQGLRLLQWLRLDAVREGWVLNEPGLLILKQHRLMSRETNFLGTNSHSITRLR